MSTMSDTIGENIPDLKALRESRGLTIEAIYNATKVRPAFLEAIESGNYEVLPERIYSEAFIKSYAAQIGISPEDILARYRRFLKVPETGKVPDKKSEKKEKRRDESKPQAAAPELKSQEPSKGTAAPVVKSRVSGQKRRLSRVAVSLSLTVLVICGGFLYFLLSDNASGPEELMKTEKPAAPGPAATDTKDVKPAETPQQTAADQPGTNAAQPAPADQSAPAADMKPAAAASNKLIIYANELTWISVTEDGGPPYQIMLRPGDNLERIAGKFMLDIGNAGGIVINLNGADLGVPGRSGQVVHLILPQEPGPEAPKE